MSPHELTDEERTRGRENRWAEYRRRQERAEQLLAGHIDQAIASLAAAVAETDDAGKVTLTRADANALRAATEILDRTIGKPVQRTELTGADGGPVVVENDVNADTAEAILVGLEGAGLIAGRATNGDAPADEIHPAPSD